MAELWQAYGSWVLYGLFFVLMIFLHGRMHGAHAYGGRGNRGMHAADANSSAAQAQSDAAASKKADTVASATGHAHGQTRGRSGHTHRGCC